MQVKYNAYARYLDGNNAMNPIYLSLIIQNNYSSGKEYNTSYNNIFRFDFW